MSRKANPAKANGSKTNGSKAGPTRKRPGPAPAAQRMSLRARIVLVVLITLAVAVVWVSNDWLTTRYTETTRSRAELRMALYSGNLKSELQRNSVVPLLLSRDPTLMGALASLVAAADLLP